MRTLLIQAAIAAGLGLALFGNLPARKVAVHETLQKHPPLIAPQKLNRVLKQVAELVPCSLGQAYQWYWKEVIVVHPTPDECHFKVDLFGICVDMDGCI